MSALLTHDCFGAGARLRGRGLALGCGIAMLCVGCSWGHRNYKPHIAAAWQPGCVEYRDYFDANDMALDKGRSLASNICVEDGGLSIGVVEFDDEGTHWDRQQLRRLEEEIQAVGDAQAAGTIPTEGILLMSFVHGWGNSASEGSSALLDFRKIAKHVAGSPGICNGRERCESRPYVMAAYLAWHADSLGLNSVYAKTRTRRTDWLGALRMPTFWARKSAARRAGGTPMTETLLRLLGAVEAADSRRRQQTAVEGRVLAKSRSVVVGHSLGAAVVERAFAQVLVARYLDRSGPLANADERVDNLVVMLNPASEALAAVNLINALESAGTTASTAKAQPPRIVSIASVRDSVTSRILPGGLYLGRALTLRPTNRMRSKTRFGTMGQLITRTATHVAGAQSHRLQREPSAGEREPSAGERQGLAPCNNGPCADADVGRLFRIQGSYYRLYRAADHVYDAPYWIFTVPPELLPDHREVFTPGVYQFILDLMRF